MFRQSGEWFECLTALPYDATFRLEALLDCLYFLMGPIYGKFQLEYAYKIELLQLGFGFVNLTGRFMWVYSVESMLYNFNLQCKFMLPCRQRPPPLRVLSYHSHHRAAAENMPTVKCGLLEDSNADLSKR